MKRLSLHFVFLLLQESEVAAAGTSNAAGAMGSGGPLYEAREVLASAAEVGTRWDLGGENPLAAEVGTHWLQGWLPTG